jgi:hypothetical protein
LLPDIAFLSEVLPVVLYLVRFKQNRGEGLGVIFFYCCLSWLTESFFLKLLHLHIPYNVHDAAFTIVEFTIISYFTYTSLRGKKAKYFPIIGSLIFYPVDIISLTKEQGSFDSVPASLEAVIIILYCILLLYEQINNPEVLFVYTTKKFWVTIAFFLYFSSTLFLFIYARNFTITEYAKYWNINNFFEILKNILFSVSFILNKSSKNLYPQDLNPDF